MSKATDKSKDIEINVDSIKLDKKILKYKDSIKQLINDSPEKKKLSDSEHLNTYDNESYKAVLNKLKETLWNDILEIKNQNIVLMI